MVPAMVMAMAAGAVFGMVGWVALGHWLCALLSAGSRRLWRSLLMLPSAALRQSADALLAVQRYSHA